MGDRGNIKLIGKPEGEFPHPIYFYGHWMGSEMKAILARALQRGRQRWDDGSYLARIIFCEMIGDDTKSLTSFGISTSAGDNEYPFLVVDVDKKVVFEEPDTRRGFEHLAKRPCMEPMGWDDFIQKFHEPQIEPVIAEMTKVAAKAAKH